MLKCLDLGTGEQSLHNKKPPAPQMAIPSLAPRFRLDRLAVTKTVAICCM